MKLTKEQEQRIENSIRKRWEPDTDWKTEDVWLGDNLVAEVSVCTTCVDIDYYTAEGEKVKVEDYRDWDEICRDYCYENYKDWRERHLTEEILRMQI